MFTPGQTHDLFVSQKAVFPTCFLTVRVLSRIGSRSIISEKTL